MNNLFFFVLTELAESIMAKGWYWSAALTALVAGGAVGVRAELRLALQLTIELVDVVQAVWVIWDTSNTQR